MSQTIAPLLTQPSADAASRRNFAKGAQATDIRPASSWRVDRSAAEVKASDSDFSFGDLLDVLNPLQHIPVVGHLYRAATGDAIKPAAQVAGDVAYGVLAGGLLLGGIASVANAVIEEKSGKDLPTQVVDALFGDSPSTPEAKPPVQLASAEPPKPEATAPAPQAAPAQPVQVAAAEPPAKQPYGGVMAPASAPRLGSTIYTSPLLNRAARVATTPEPPSAAPTSRDTQALAQLMHSQAKAGASPNQLPPDLVRDMMLMGLEKYRTAEGMGAASPSPRVP